jgi:hypothetical protein
MAIKIREKEVIFCDFCNQEAAHGLAIKCINCHKHACLNCNKESMTEYSHAVYFSGSDDGHYCNDCDSALTGKDALHNAYVEIQKLKEERKKLFDNFDNRSKIAEALIKKLLSERA